MIELQSPYLELNRGFKNQLQLNLHYTVYLVSDERLAITEYELMKLARQVLDILQRSSLLEDTMRVVECKLHSSM